jgi:hypothetical protein
MLEDKPFLFGTSCHHEKCGGFGLCVRTLLSLGVGYLISWLLPYLLEWDNSLSMCWFLSYSLCSLDFALFTCWTLESILWLFDSLIYFGQPFIASHLCVDFWFIWCFVQLYLLLVLESLVHAYLPNVYHMACFTFFDPIYRVNSNKSQFG